jgi:hypothetical protein
MKPAIEFAPEDFNDSILPSQYNDLVRRRAPLNDGEYRLLWAVLEDAIRSYLANRKWSNPIQRMKFEEVRSWFEPSQAEPRSGLSFQTICDLLGIDRGQLLKGLKSLNGGEFPRRRHRLTRNARPRTLAA